MLEKSHLKYIYSRPLYAINENQPLVKKEEAQAELQKPAESLEIHPDVVRKHVVILYAGQGELSAEESGQLIKILQAVNVALADTALVNTASLKAAANYSDLIQQYNYSKLISFGSPVEALGLNLNKNAITVLDTRKYLLTDSLPELIKDVAKKRVLWGTLKELFAVSGGLDSK